MRVFLYAVSSATYLREAFLLQVGDNTLAQEIRRPDNIQHLLVIVPEQRKLEAVLGGVNGDGARPCRTIQTVYSLALHARQVDGVVEGANYAMVTKGALA